jgi:eukaryotic-like serine/threonine-protein kinase
MKLVRILLYLIACVVVFIFSTALSVKIFLPHENTVPCPDLAGLDYFEAKSQAEVKGFYLIIDRYEKRKDVPYNRVIVQKPDPSLPVRKGRTIMVVVSDGPRPVFIPSFVGHTLEESQTMLEEQHIKLKNVLFVPAAEPGKIVAQVPAAGENIIDEEGMVLIAGGRAKRYFMMPDVQKDSEGIIEEMDRKDIKYAVTNDGSVLQGMRSNVPAGTIFNDETILDIKLPIGG